MFVGTTGGKKTFSPNNYYLINFKLQLEQKLLKFLLDTFSRCGAPVEMIAFTFQQLYEEHYTMRCLDKYGAEPDKDAALLIGVLAGNYFV